MVTYGITHNLVQTKLYSLSMEKRERRKSLYSFVNNILQEPQACLNSLKGQALSGSSTDTERSFELTALKDVSDDTLMDFTKDGNGNLTDSATKNQLKNLGVDKFEKLEFRYKPARSSMGQVVLTSRTEVKGLHEKSNREIVWEISALKVETVSGHGDQVTSCHSQISLFVSEEGRGSDPHSGPGANVFAGHLAGVSNHSSTNGNVFVGYAAGWKNTTGRDNTFIGTASGMKNTTGLENTFIGEGAGADNVTHSFNTFLGFHAGLKSNSHANTFIGTKAGENNTLGWDNVFVGNWAGQLNTTGTTNVFIGKDAGLKNTTGRQNVFIGDSSGEYNITGEYNTYIGTYAGERNTGSNNIIIGYNAELTSHLSSNNVFVIGHKNVDTDWITGTIGGNSLRVRGSETVNASSRTLKKDISRFFEFEESLQDILSTPLFNYSYREEALHPEKQRMGLIAEELPEHLRLPGEDYPHPDWPSIYGTLWAGIKALHQKLETLFTDNTAFHIKLEALFADSSSLKQELERANEQIETLRSLTSTTSIQLEKANQEIETLRKELDELKSNGAAL